MSDNFFKQLSQIAGLMAIAVVFGLTAFASNLEIKDLDLWLHIKTGEYICQHHTVPSHDVLSCSIAGKPWVNHEWLFQVIVYNIQHCFGFDGLITMQSIIVCLSFLVLLLIAYRRDRQWLAVFCLLLVMLVYQSRFTIRPDIFSLLFFALDMAILTHYVNRSWSLWVMAAIQLLWVNMHGFSLFGPILVLVVIMAELIKRHLPLPYEWNSVGRVTEDEFKKLLKILGVLVLASLVNPLGIEGALYPIKVLFQSSGESQVFFKHIYELQRPFLGGVFANTSENVHYKILIIISTLTFFLNRRRIDVRLFLIWLIFLLFSLAAIRNLVFFSFAAYLVIMINSLSIVADEILPIQFSAQRYKDLTSVMMKGVLICWMLNYGSQTAVRGYFDFDTYERKSEYGGVSKRTFAYKAVDFLVDEGIKGNFFNDFNSGAYLIGRTSPNIKVFIDGRTEVYGAKFFERYQKIWKHGDKKVFAQVEREFKLTGAFLNGANQEIPSKAISMFYHLKDWHLVYFDHDGMIFLKDTPENQKVILKHTIDLTRWQPPLMDLKRLGAKRMFPFPYIDRAKMLLALKLDGPAMKELNALAKLSPDVSELYQLRGDIYGHQKKYRLAFENFRIATVLAPSERRNHIRLAWAYEQLGDKKNAIKQYERLLADKPDDAKIAAKLKKLKGDKKK